MFKIYCFYKIIANILIMIRLYSRTKDSSTHSTEHMRSLNLHFVTDKILLNFILGEVDASLPLFNDDKLLRQPVRAF